MSDFCRFWRFWYRFGIILGSIWGHFSVILAPGASLGCLWSPESGLEWLEGVLGGPLGVLGRPLRGPWGTPGASLCAPWESRERPECGLGSTRALPWGAQGAPTRRLPSDNESSFFVFEVSWGAPWGSLGHPWDVLVGSVSAMGRPKGAPGAPLGL